jgi:hypothetical protein
MLPSKGSETHGRVAPLFPLPFTPFEYYYYLDDCPAYPTAFPVELRFSGRLVRDHFTAALERTLARHPMLCAVVDDSGRRPVWIADKRGRPFVDWADESVAIAHPAGEYIDLKAESGLRTWVRASPGGARVLFQIHHACCDGLSALQFLADFLASYKAAAEADDEGAGLRDLDAQLLHRRGQIVGDADAKGSFATAVRDVYVAGRVWSRILFRTPEVLAAPAKSGTSDEHDSRREMLVFETGTLTGDQTGELRRVAKSLEVTPNDLLLRDFLVVLRTWNRQQAGSSRGRLRVNVPVNVRRRDEIRMPAANRIGFGFVTAEPGDGDDPIKLLEAVRVEMQRTKEWKLGLYFLGGLEMASKVPGVLRWALSRKRSLATAVLSNVGRFVPDASPARREDRWKCGDLVLEQIAGVPPIRKLTRAAVIVAEYGGETMICLRCDPHYFNRQQTQALLNAYMDQLRETLRRGAQNSC